MKWHLTIKDNETGETVKELDICSIIAGVGTEDGAIELAMASCIGTKVVETAACTENALSDVYADNPIAKLIVDALRKRETENENN